MSYDYVQAERILQNGADPDIRDEYGRTLLMCIAVHEPYYSAEDSNRYELADSSGWNDDEDIQMMELLLEYGADIDAAVPDCGDPTAHEYGGETGWNSIYANSDHPCGNTALIYAVRYRSADVIEFFLENGADVNAANDCGFTPLLMCVDMRTDNDDGLEITEMLLEEGADPYAVTNFHQDITWLVMRHGNDDNDQISALIDEALW
jgi:ankyrin repeat protein